MISVDLYTRPRKKDLIITVKCTYDDNTMASEAPDRNWNKSRMWWELPIGRLNIEYLRLNREKYVGSQDFFELLDGYGKEDGNSLGSFPSNYPFKLKPFNHQGEALEKFYPLEVGAMFADIGTGKTKVAIDLATARYIAGTISKVLVICLVSIKDNWGREIIKNSPVTPSSHILKTTKAGQKKFDRFQQEDGFKWLIVGVESLSAGKAFGLCEQYVTDDTFIIIDESQYIKTPDKIRTNNCIELGKRTKYKMVMTGTPITQGLADIYSPFEFLDKDIVGIGDYRAFRNRYMVMGGYEDRQIIGYKKTDELMETLSPYVYQVRKRDVLTDLPKSSYKTLTVEMSAEQKRIYNDLKRELRMECNGNTLTVKSTINLMQRFSEITGGFYSYIDQEAMEEVGVNEKVKIKYKKEYLQKNPKANELMKFIDTLPEDEPLIIWAAYNMEREYLIKILSEKYGSYKVVQMDGSIKREQRTINLDRFEAGEARFLVGNPKVGGVGLNMTSACITAYFSNDFSLEKRLQSEGRTERSGQLRPMLFVDMVCTNSIDGYVSRALVAKNDFAEEVRKAFDNGMLEELV